MKYDHNHEHCDATCPTNKAAVDHPQHYRAESGVEAIEVIEAWGLNFALGNVIKYVCRAGLKDANVVEDLEKALWYLEREIERRGKL